MVPIAEILFVLVVMAFGTRWYLRTPMHRARKSSGVFPPQVHGHMGFGMYTPSNPPLLPHALHDYHSGSTAGQEPDTDVAPEPGDA
jgi:hypothetical protein